jgi:hypothetical protein
VRRINNVRRDASSLVQHGAKLSSTQSLAGRGMVVRAAVDTSPASLTNDRMGTTDNAIVAILEMNVKKSGGHPFVIANRNEKSTRRVLFSQQ